MLMPKVLNVVGFKDSGKTRLIESLTQELIRRGLSVGVIKHTASPYPLDTPGKDTWRYAQAGAKSVSILTPTEASIFFYHPEKIDAIINIMKPLDLILIEGFKELDRVPRIIFARNEDEFKLLRNGLEIAIIGRNINSKFPNLKAITFSSCQTKELADLVFEKAIPLLPGLDCQKCGFPSCSELAKEVMQGKAKVSKCVNMPSEEVTIVVDGSPIKVNSFVGRIMKKVIMGILSTLKGAEPTKKIVVQCQVGNEEFP